MHFLCKPVLGQDNVLLKCSARSNYLFVDYLRTLYGVGYFMTSYTSGRAV